MNSYERVIGILEAAVGGETIKGHGNFWRNKTLDQFKAQRVYGLRLIQVGNGADSYLIKSLAGIVPFGLDVPPPVVGETIPRMPLRRPPVAEEDIAFIQDWIDRGCPEEEEDEEPTAFMKMLSLRSPPGIRNEEELFNDFFRDFDDVFMFNSTEDTSASVGLFMSQVAGFWPGLAATTFHDWSRELFKDDAQESVAYLAKAQISIMERHFGNPLNLGRLNEALRRFGDGSLPNDPLRPADQRHWMDGSTMWLIWLAFVSAAVELNIERERWMEIGQSIVVGLVHDAIFRLDRPSSERLRITRYDITTEDLMNRILADLPIDDPATFQDALVSISREARGAAATT